VSARTKSRKRALDVLFAADVRGDALEDALAREEDRARSTPERASSWPYAREIVEGVRDHAAEIDDSISAHASGWELDRMPAVDRAILRIGAWELGRNPEVPTGVAIDEAVELAKELSTDDSPRFVNGVLSAVARDVRPEGG
jgi:transcription antitermination protein NusB